MRYVLKLIFILSFCWALPSANASAPGTYAYYGFAEQGPFSNFDIYTTWVSAPAPAVNANIYPAFQFWFQNATPGYMGTILGDNGTTRGVHFSIWDRDDNPSTPPTATWDSVSSPGCLNFGGEGTGVQCPLPNYNWVTGREYRLRVVSAGFDATGENWRGEIKDMVTGITTVMGTIHLANTPATATKPSYAGYGRLTSGVTFLEYYTGTTCTGNPASKVSWRGPYAENELYTARYASATYNGCVNLNVSTNTGKPISIHEIGDGVQHTTVDWQELWNSPLVTTEPMTGSTPNCATLKATINTWGLADNLSFQYGVTPAFGTTTPNNPVTSSTPTSVSSTVCSLTPNTTYYARAVGTYNDPVQGPYITNGDTLQFTLDANGNIATGSVISAPPVVDPAQIAYISQTTATLSAKVNTNGSAGRAYAQCKTNTGNYVGYGVTPPMSLAMQSIKGRVLSFNLTGLTANTAYTCFVGAWNNGTQFDTKSATKTFTTLSYPLPTATSTPATQITRTSATLNGACNFNGISGTAVFEYWKSAKTPIVMTTATQTFGAATTPYSITQGISGLSSATNYGYRVKCTSSAGSRNGSSLTFKTL